MLFKKTVSTFLLEYLRATGSNRDQIQLSAFTGWFPKMTSAVPLPACHLPALASAVTYAPAGQFHTAILSF